MWILTEFEPRCTTCKKPIKPEQQYTNNYLNTAARNAEGEVLLAEIHRNIPIYHCCGVTIPSPELEITSFILEDWAAGERPQFNA